MMGVPEFYLNALPEYRRDTVEFLLSLNQFMFEKTGHSGFEQQQSPLPSKYHPKFSPDIGDTVLFYAHQFSQQREFAFEINEVVGVMQDEQVTEIPRIRDHLLRLANENILCQLVNPFVDKPSCVTLGFRDYLMVFVDQYSEARNIKKAYQDKLKGSVTSPGMNHLRKLVEFYGLHLNRKDPKAYLKFYACISALFMKIDASMLNDSLFQVLGEVENVIHRYKDTFPGYVSLDNFAKFRKLLLAGKVQPMNE